MVSYGSLNHGSTVIVVKTKPEQAYLIQWAKDNNKYVSARFKENVYFPMCYSLHSDVMGWTAEMDRALNYKSFNEFMGLIT